MFSKQKSSISPIVLCMLLALMISSGNLNAQKPIVWIYTDMTNPELPGPNKEGTLNDPDDVSAMAGYLLMANMFDTRGIVVGSTHRSQHANSPNQADWARQFFGQAYQTDLPQLNHHIGGYPTNIPFMQSCIKETAERFQPEQSYSELDSYNSVQALLTLAEKEQGPINVLCWGSLTEPAILVRHCLHHGRTSTLKKLRFIAHWTSSYLHQGSMDAPQNVANCREDAQACAYLKEAALNGHISYYECAATGQHGIVSGSPKGMDYFQRFKVSKLGTIFVEGKFAHNSVDHSDAATYWALLGNWGLSLKDIPCNGTNYPELEKENEMKFKNYSKYIHDELLRRSKAAAQ